MNGISAKQTNTKEKNSDAEHSIPSTIMRGTFNIIRRILAWILKKLIFTIFLILLFLRRPVLAVLNFFAGASALAFLMFFYGYLIERREATADEAGISLALMLAIGEGVFSVCCMYASWGYDALLFRLAPPGYVLILPE
ncbi:hypothetical protein [Bartonella jaculi]|uniref:Uncharacterized protein n=1 Tax=Bartonella jaculi TaxID=686226 RepID=A0ABP9N7E0_9HYPH